MLLIYDVVVIRLLFISTIKTQEEALK